MKAPGCLLSIEQTQLTIVFVVQAGHDDVDYVAVRVECQFGWFWNLPQD